MPLKESKLLVNKHWTVTVQLLLSNCYCPTVTVLFLKCYCLTSPQIFNHIWSYRTPIQEKLVTLES